MLYRVGLEEERPGIVVTAQDSQPKTSAFESHPHYLLESQLESPV